MLSMYDTNQVSNPKNVDVKRLSLVIAAIVIPAVVFLWAHARQVVVEGPTFIHPLYNGHVMVLINDRLVELSMKGEVVEQYGLAKFGIQRMAGDFAPLPSGEVLLSRLDYDGVNYPSQGTFNLKGEKLQKSGLSRCNLDTAACQTFAEYGRPLDSTFQLTRDAHTGVVYISDTDRNQVRKISPEGKVLGVMMSDLSDPAQTLVHKAKLYIANSYGKNVKVIDATDEEFLKASKSIDVVPNIEPHRYWPYMIERVGEQWWLTFRDDATHGHIYLYDSNWTFVRRLVLPEGSHPFAVLALAGEAWITDSINRKIYRYDYSGSPLGEIRDPALQQVFDDLDQSVVGYIIFKWAVLLLCLISLVAIFAHYNRKARANVSRQNPDFTPIHLQAHDPQIQWVERNWRFSPTFYLYVLFCFIAAGFALYGYMDPRHKSFNIWVIAMVVLLGQYLISLVVEFQKRNIRLGRLHDAIVFDTGNKIFAAKAEQVGNVKNELLFGDKTLTFSRLQFDKSSFNDILGPLLKMTRKIDPLAARMMNQPMSTPKALLFLLLLLAPFVFAFYLLLK